MNDRIECYVVVSYGLRKANSDDYENFRTALQRIGLNDFITRDADGKSMELPSTTYSGKISGESRKQITDKVRNAVYAMFGDSGVEGTFLISVSRDSSVILGQYAGPGAAKK